MNPERAETLNQRMHAFADNVGSLLVDAFHYLALFAIGGVTVWSAGVAFIAMVEKGHAASKRLDNIGFRRSSSGVMPCRKACLL